MEEEMDTFHTIGLYKRSIVIFFVGGEESSTPKNEENEPLDMIC